MNISFIIPNYNGAAIIEKNIPHVLHIAEAYARAGKGEVEIIIIDDGSTDTSKEVLTNMFNDYRLPIVVRLLFNNKNYGFSSTVNRGVAAAKGEIVILLNTDVTPEKDFLTPLLSHFSNEQVFGVGCMDKSIEKGETVLRGRGIGKWEKGILHHAAGELDKTDTLWISGGSGAFRKSIWDELGGLTELMNPFYWEDVDLGYRAWKAGYTLVFEKESVVVHAHEEGSIKSTQSERKIQTIAFRNQYMFTLLNATDPKIMKDFFTCFPIRLLKALRAENSAEFQGMMKLVRVFPKILALRKRNIKLFKKTDAEIITKFSSENE